MLKGYLKKKDIKRIKDYNFSYLLDMDILTAIDDLNKVITYLKDDSIESKTKLYNLYIQDALSYYKDTGNISFETWLIDKQTETKILLDNASNIKDLIVMRIK